MPLQQDSAAVLGRTLKALVDVFHEQVHSILIQRLNSLLYVSTLEGAEHLQHQTFSTILQKVRQNLVPITSQV